jgi:hypothetical protein
MSSAGLRSGRICGAGVLPRDLDPPRELSLGVLAEWAWDLSPPRPRARAHVSRRVGSQRSAHAPFRRALGTPPPLRNRRRRRGARAPRGIRSESGVLELEEHVVWRGDRVREVREPEAVLAEAQHRGEAGRRSERDHEARARAVDLACEGFEVHVHRSGWWKRVSPRMRSARGHVCRRRTTRGAARRRPRRPREGRVCSP